MSEAPIHALAVRIREISTAHGFWPPEGRNFGEMVALAHSELSESLEEHRNGQPAIYWKCKTCGLSSTGEPRPGDIHQMPKQGVWWRMLAAMRFRPHPDFRFYDCDERDGGFKPEGAAVELMDAIIRELDTVLDMLEPYPYTVDDLIEIKMAYNAGRPYKHGRAY